MSPFLTRWNLDASKYNPTFATNTICELLYFVAVALSRLVEPNNLYRTIRYLYDSPHSKAMLEIAHPLILFLGQKAVAFSHLQPLLLYRT
jgi:hypothetical protein